MYRKALDLIRNKNFPIFALIAFNLLIGTIIVDDFGESWDEEKYIIYAEDSLFAYENLGTTLDESKLGPGNLIYYGPAYITFSKIVHNLLGYMNSGIPTEIIYHFMYFVSFQIGIFSLYVINRRFVNHWAAIGATLFFATQPLLFGHAFINPKDIPFMAFFLATIASGLWLADSKINDANEVKQSNLDKLVTALSRDWDTERTHLIRLRTWIITAISIGIALFLARAGINSLLSGWIEALLSADPTTPLGHLAGRLAENSGEIASQRYVEKGIAIYWRAYSLLFGAVLLFFLFAILRRFRHARSEIWMNMIIPYFKEFNVSLPKIIWGNLSNPKLLFAGMILGICTAIRVIGPAAGGLVAIYLISQWRRHSVAAIISYFSVGALVTYLLWPYLWAAPFARYLESLSLMTSFPWEGKILFDGALYRSVDLPSSYLPSLLLLKFTEPTAILFLGGLTTAIYFAITRRKNITSIFLLFLWFWTPILFIIFSRPPVYDNFRQFLFIIPPIFIFTGIFLDAIYKKLKHKWVFILLIAGIITPGVYSSIILHPYEYTYYNQFVGGLDGAFRNYELDYWVTSYKEAMEYLNDISDPGASIVVWGAPRIARSYARDDLIIQNIFEVDPGDLNKYDFGLISTRQNRDRNVEFNGEVVFQVARENAVFAIVIRIVD